MARNEKGITLIELLIAVACLLAVLGGAMTLFAEIAGQYKQQGKLAESGVERLIGLELLRQDIELAGYGIPWHLPAGFNYVEAGDGNDDAPSNPPRGILCDNDGGFNGSDRLIVKSAGVGTDPLCRRWTLLDGTGTPRPWLPAAENLRTGDRVIVIDPGTTEDNLRTLVVSGAFHAAFPPGAGFASPIAGVSRVVYGIDNGASLRMPFNRAEYAIDNTNVPFHCAPNTGVLVKRLVSHADGALGTALPLLDCVAAMEVEFGMDTDGDRGVDQTSDGDAVAALDAPAIRRQVQQVRVSILVQEGQKNPDYTHPTGTISVQGQNVPVDVKYRWRLHDVVVKPINLGG